MNKLVAAALAATVAVTGISSAQAAQGCGPGGHRGYYGHCRPNGGPGGPVLIVGRHYDQGWWDGRRYWHDRYRAGPGWRYR